MGTRISQTGLEEEVQWDCQLRQSLCCMMRFFVFPPQAFESVFSEIYRNELKSRGLEMQDAVSYDYLHREWSTMKRRNSGVWHHVHTDTSFRREGEWESKILQIQSTAAMLGITIAQQERDPVEPLTCDGRKFDGEYLESVLLVNSSRTNAELEPVSFTCNFTVSDPLPIQESIEEHDDAMILHVERGSVPESIHTEALVLSHGKRCIWCEWEMDEREMNEVEMGERERGDREWEVSEENQCMGSLSPFHNAESTRAEFDENTSDRSIWSSQENESPLRQLGSIYESNLLDRPGQCSRQDYPPLLFRWWNVNSQGINTRTCFIAGAFSELKSPEEGLKLESMGRNDFMLAFRNHVLRAPVKSPFVSTFRSPFAPIHRAIRYQDGAVVSVIDPSKLETSLFKASPLVDITKTGYKSWNGWGEYVVWGSIPSAAIVCTFNVSTLLDIAKVNPMIGSFLQLPLIHSSKYCDTALYARIAWRLKSHHEHDAALSRLMELLNVPLQYRPRMCRCFKESWLTGCKYLDLEPARDRLGSEFPEEQIPVWPNDMPIYPLPPGHEVPIWPNDMPIYPLPCTPANRARTTESEISYRPPPDEDDSDWESSEEERKDSQSPDARCPRRDTSSSGFSVCDDSDSDVPRRQASPPTSPMHGELIFKSKPPIPISFAGRQNIQKTPEVSETEMGDTWPSDGENYLSDYCRRK